jgi:predicted GNAT family acetyltransferase
MRLPAWRRSRRCLLIAAIATRALYTDLANPTSNTIYQRIGYEHLCDAGEYVLG